MHFIIINNNIIGVITIDKRYKIDHTTKKIYPLKRKGLSATNSIKLIVALTPTNPSTKNTSVAKNNNQ